MFWLCLRIGKYLQSSVICHTLISASDLATSLASDCHVTLPIEDNVLNYGGISGLRHLYADLTDKPRYLQQLLLLSAQAFNLKHLSSADEDDRTPGRVRSQKCWAPMAKGLGQHGEVAE